MGASGLGVSAVVVIANADRKKWRGKTLPRHPLAPSLKTASRRGPAAGAAAALPRSHRAALPRSRCGI